MSRNKVAVFIVGETRLEDAERELILKTLAVCGNDKEETARILEVDRKTIYNKLHTYGAKGERHIRRKAVPAEAAPVEVEQVAS